MPSAALLSLLSPPSTPALPRICSYPQTGATTLLPLVPPYNRLVFMAAGGSAKEKANSGTPASNQAHMIEVRVTHSVCRGACGAAALGWQVPAQLDDWAAPRPCSLHAGAACAPASARPPPARLRNASPMPHLTLCAVQLTAGKNAKWFPVGPMPQARVMGDGVHLCDGTILFVNGASQGTAVSACGSSERGIQCCCAGPRLPCCPLRSSRACATAPACACAQGWGNVATTFKFRDNYRYDCTAKCGFTGTNNFVCEWPGGGAGVHRAAGGAL